MEIDPYEERIKVDLAIDVCDSVLRSIFNTMKSHGDDPENVVIVVTGLVMAINRLNKIDPKTSSTVASMLVTTKC